MISMIILRTDLICKISFLQIIYIHNVHVSTPITILKSFVLGVLFKVSDSTSISQITLSKQHFVKWLLGWTHAHYVYI
jgi:hypothetical protein